MPGTAIIDLTFPVEWEELFYHQESIEMGTADRDFEGFFAFEEWQQWCRDHPNWEYVGLTDRHEDLISTRNHDTPEYEGMTLSCRRMSFRVHLDQAQSSRHPVRKELRISVPPPTKLPLPRDL